MKKYVIIFLIAFNILYAGVILGGVNSTAVITLSNMDNKPDQIISMQISISNISSLKGCHITLSYDGEVDKVSFVADKYLHNPLYIGPIHNKENNTIEIIVMATNKVITIDPTGEIGKFVFGTETSLKNIEIVKSVFLDGNYNIDAFEYGNIKSLSTGLSMQESTSISNEFITQMENNYPNPGNPGTIFNFTISEQCHVRLEIYDISGKVVNILLNKQLTPDKYSIAWDGKNESGKHVSSGIYFYRFIAGEHIESDKVIIIK